MSEPIIEARIRGAEDQQEEFRNTIRNLSLQEEYFGDGFKVRFGGFGVSYAAGGMPKMLSTFAIFSERGAFLGTFEVVVKKGLTRDDVLMGARDVLGKNWEPGRA